MMLILLMLVVVVGANVVVVDDVVAHIVNLKICVWLLLPLRPMDSRADMLPLWSKCTQMHTDQPQNGIKYFRMAVARVQGQQEL
jgi:hypothetical protein